MCGIKQKETVLQVVLCFIIGLTDIVAINIALTLASLTTVLGSTLFVADVEV